MVIRSRLIVLVVAAFLLAIFAQATHWHDRDVAHHGSDDSHCTLCLHLSHLGDTSTPFVYTSPPLASQADYIPFTASARSLDITHSWFARGPPIV